MNTTLKHLCKYAKENYEMELICGEKNMSNLVNWVHMLEDPETANFLHGQELIFTTGIGHNNTEWFMDFVRCLVVNKASGLVLNIGPYIKEVPDEVLAYCNEVQFPLFTIPWKTRIVDITNDFCHKIMRAEENELTVATAFRNAVFFPKKAMEYRPILERKAFDLEAEFSVVAISYSLHEKDSFSIYDKNVRLHLSKILFSHSDRFNIFRQDKYLIVIMQSFPEEVVTKSIERLCEVCHYGHKSNHIYAGISMNDYGIMSLPRNYKRAVASLRLSEKQNNIITTYSSLGIYQLLVEIEDIKVLKKYYEGILGDLESYDEKNQTDYIMTLKIYLDHNCSVEKVAKATFVHRNTINYKIRKIKEILNIDLNYKEGLNLLLAFHIKDLL